MRVMGTALAQSLEVSSELEISMRHKDLWNESYSAETSKWLR